MPSPVTYLLLDLDGVLITTGPWKPDDIDVDGYSRFNSKAVQNLNTLLQKHPFEIWLSSSRRLHQSLETMNAIFAQRGIVQPIKGFLPHLPASSNRKAEIETFLTDRKVAQYLILDDDKSLNSLPSHRKKYLVQTAFLLGFNDEKLRQALDVMAALH